MAALEGSRPLLTDVQALVATTVFGNPRRMASGIDQGRLALLLAVMEKRANFRLYDKDVYINIAGGSVGLSKDSVILLEQIRTIDKRRLREHMGRLDDKQMSMVDDAIAVSFGLPESRS